MRDDLHALAGAYALDALREDERAAFEHHLARCEVCKAEIYGFAETAARLSQAVAERPPPYLRDQVLGHIGHIQQVPGSVPDLTADVVRINGAARHRRGARRRRRPYLAIAVAAASLIAAGGAGALAYRTQERLDKVEAAAQDMAAVLSAPDARVAVGKVKAGGTVTIVTSRSHDKVVITGSALGRLTPAQSYQLWLISDKGARSAGVVSPDGSGGIHPHMVGPLRDAERVGVTVEPKGGSQQPTTAPLVLLKMPRA